METASDTNAVARAILADIDKATRKMEWAGLVPENKRDMFEAIKSDLLAVMGDDHFNVSGKFSTAEELKGYVGTIVENFMEVLDESEIQYDMDDVEAFVSGHIITLLDTQRNGGFEELWSNYREFSWDEQMYRDLNGFAQEFNFRASQHYAGLEEDIFAFTHMVEMLNYELDIDPDYMPDAAVYIAGFCDLSSKIERIIGEDQKPYRNYMLSVYGLG